MHLLFRLIRIIYALYFIYPHFDHFLYRVALHPYCSMEGNYFIYDQVRYRAISIMTYFPHQPYYSDTKAKIPLLRNANATQIQAYRVISFVRMRTVNAIS